MSTKTIYPKTFFNNNLVSIKLIFGNILGCISIQNYLLTFKSKQFKLTSIQNFQQVLPRPCLINVYNAFIRPHLGYGCGAFVQAFNDSFHMRLEYVQYKAALSTAKANN